MQASEMKRAGCEAGGQPADGDIIIVPPEQTLHFNIGLLNKANLYRYENCPTQVRYIIK